MIKNIIFDIGGVILDDSNANISKVFNKDMESVCKKAYGGNFRACILGKMSMKEHLEEYLGDPDYDALSKMLNPDNLNIMCPLLKENYDYICTLKEKGYHLYILSNLTKETYEYLNKTIDIPKYFDGAVFSYEIGMRKPDREIFEYIINKFNLRKEETIFFDDKQKNINASNDFGIKGFVFNSIEDIKENL